MSIAIKLVATALVVAAFPVGAQEASFELMGDALSIEHSTGDVLCNNCTVRIPREQEMEFVAGRAVRDPGSGTLQLESGIVIRFAGGEFRMDSARISTDPSGHNVVVSPALRLTRKAATL